MSGEIREAEGKGLRDSDVVEKSLRENTEWNWRLIMDSGATEWLEKNIVFFSGKLLPETKYG